MADYAEELFNQMPQQITATIELLNAILWQRTYNSGLPSEERKQLSKDIDILRRLTEKDPGTLSDKDLETLSEIQKRNVWVTIPEAYYSSYKEKLDDRGVVFDVFNCKNYPKRALFFNVKYQKEMEEVQEEIAAENFHIKEVSRDALRDIARAEGQDLREITGLSKDELDLFRQKAHSITYAILYNRSSDSYSLMFQEKDLGIAEDTLFRSQFELTTPLYGAFSRERLEYERDYELEVYKAVNGEIGEVQYLCSRDSDEYVEIRENSYRWVRYGKEYERGDFNQDKPGQDDRARYEASLYEAVRSMYDGAFFQEAEFSRDYEKRKEILAQKKHKPMRSDLDKEARYRLHKEAENEKVMKHLLMEKKMSLDNRDERELVSGMYDAMVTFSKYDENNRENAECEKEVMQCFRKMDLDDRQDMYALISGLSPEELESMTDHIEELLKSMDRIEIEENVAAWEWGQNVDDPVHTEEYDEGSRSWYDVHDKNANGRQDEYERPGY